MFSVDQANLGNTQTAASDTTIRSEHDAGQPTAVGDERL
jgi:hypothetical protein